VKTKHLLLTIVVAACATTARSEQPHNYVSKMGGGWYAYKNAVDGSELRLSYSVQGPVHRFRLVPRGDVSLAQEYTCVLPCNVIADDEGVKEATSSEKMILPMVQDMLKGALDPS
jgi:hypothetical protein